MHRDSSQVEWNQFLETDSSSPPPHASKNIFVETVVQPPIFTCLWLEPQEIDFLVICNKNVYILVSFNLVGVSDRGVLNQLVKVNCVPLISDGDAKRYKVYTGSGNWCPTSSLRDRSCILCTKMLVVGGYKLGERGS